MMPHIFTRFGRIFVRFAQTPNKCSGVTCDVMYKTQTRGDFFVGRLVKRMDETYYIEGENPNETYEYKWMAAIVLVDKRLGPMWDLDNAVAERLAKLEREEPQRQKIQSKRDKTKKS